jgi:hypothetical protein
MNNFSDEQMENLLVNGFTDGDINYLQTLGLDMETLYGNIEYMLDNGSTRDEIMSEIGIQQNEEVEGREENAVEEGEDKFVGVDEQKEATMNGGKQKKRKGKINRTTRNIRKSKGSRKPRKGRKMRKTKRRGTK